MKLYTKSGDDGTTGLFGGRRVGKDDLRVHAYGTVDELNSGLGIVAATCDADRPVHARLLEILRRLQSRLFDLGADLATPEGEDGTNRVSRIDPALATEVEAWIDEIDAENETLATFVLPGGTTLAAHLHHARTVCRRAERELVALGRVEPVNPAAVVYLNRIGDLLFACARRVNRDAGIADVPWRAEA